MEMPLRIRRINRVRPRPSRTSKAKFVAEHIVLPCVMAFAAGVLVVLHFAEQPSAEVACEDAAKVAAHQDIAMGAE